MNYAKAKLKPELNLRHPDPEDCRRCRGVGLVVVRDAPGKLRVALCPEECEPQEDIEELVIPVDIKIGIIKLA